MQEALERQIKHLATLAQAQYQQMGNIGVLGGQGGVALFQFYCAQYFNDDTYADNGVAIISHCVDRINEGYAFPSYCNGIAGFGWALQHLQEKEFVELDLDDLLVPFDEYLSTQMDLDLSTGNYDFLHGAAGYAFYFLKRYDNSEGVLQGTYKTYLEKFVAALDQLAIREENKIKWESVLDHDKGSKGFNLSLSHGISSIIYLLAKIKSANIKVELITELLKGATAYLLQFEDASNQQISRFPSWVEPNTTPQYNSRIAWCYGDIGIGKALDYASEALNDSHLKEKSMEILLHTSKRLAPDTSFVRDAGFCHGSFGNAYIFNELFTANDNPNFKEAAAFWLHDGLSKHTGDPNQPFKQWNPVDNNWQFELNLLEGISGIGLSLIDITLGKTNSWNECLMLS